jgi:hypothetical protein
MLMMVRKHTSTYYVLFICGSVIDTLQIGYPYKQASSQDKLQNVHPHTVMYPTAPDLADPVVQLGKDVPNAHTHVSKAPYVRAIMCLQNVWAGSIVNTYKACGHASTMRYSVATLWLQCGYNMATVRHQHYGPFVWHRYSVK